MRIVPKSVFEAFFDRGGLKSIFEHARNLVVATILVAAGLEAVGRADSIEILGMHNPQFAGYLVAGAGCVLIALNFIDGLRRMATLRCHLGF